MLQNLNFPGLRLDPNGGAYSTSRPLTDGAGARCPQEPHPCSRPFGPRFYGSQGLTRYRVCNPTKDRFQMYAYTKFVFFSFGERRKRTR